jgi:hypothetical protein
MCGTLSSSHATVPLGFDALCPSKSDPFFRKRRHEMGNETILEKPA